METEYAGIDYGMGRTNVNLETGIRYGVIPMNEVLQAWADESEPYYGEPMCPYCGNEAIEADELTEDQEDSFEYDGTAWEYACLKCKRIFSGGDAMCEPISFYYEGDGYSMEQTADDPDSA